ncbi:CehA/McbA family metallohydrolase [Candidatus Binatia bacterium]|nr:CehA/McbA family metallohydrolase [Candidatus Binatia bacterium]
MSRFVRFVPAVAFVVLASTASGVLTPEQQKCQKQVGNAAGTFLKKVMATLQKCSNDVAKGKLPLITDCLTEAGAAAKIAKYEVSLKDKVEKSCPDPVVSALTFGGLCNGATTATALGTCLADSHRDQAVELVDTAYGSAVVLNSEQLGCQKIAAKSALSFAAKQHKFLRKCKDDIGSGALPANTDCAAANRPALAVVYAKLRAKIVKKCPDLPNSLPATLSFGVPCAGASTGVTLARCMLRSHSDGDEEMILVEYGDSASGGTALAQAIGDMADCVGGPLSRCRVGDYLLKNDKIRVVIQAPQRNLFSIGQFGGQIIDADLVRVPLDPDRDSFEEWSTSVNIEGTAHYTTIAVLNDGSNGEPAVVRVTGVDDLLDFLNPSATVAGLGYVFPSSANDVDLPVEIQTDYILKPGRNYVRVETTVQNIGGSQIKIFFGEFIGGSGQVSLFQPAYGFGEPMLTTRCWPSAANPCNVVAYAGFAGAAGVSYAYVNDDPGTSTFTDAGVTVPLIGSEMLATLVGLAGAPHAIEAAGGPYDRKTFTRHFLVADGTVSALLDIRNELDFMQTGTLQGNVTAGGSPVAGAQIAVLGNPAEGPSPMFGGSTVKNVVTHTQTDAAGNYELTLPPGTYTAMANLEGYPFEGGGSTPTQHSVTIVANLATTQNMALPATGALQVNIVDEASAAIAGKVSVVGLDPSPDPKNSQSLMGGLLVTTTGVFNDLVKDGVPYGVAQAHFAGPAGTIGPVPIEPGSYRVVVSHGPEYSAYPEDITVTASSTVTVNAEVARVTDSTGYVSGDFHVHSIDSPDSNITRADRVVSMLAEGMDFFTPSDHDFRADFPPTIAALGATSLIKTATSAEITTFDYGHFNAWPVPIDPSKVNGGGVDHGRAEPVGTDFPSLGSYSLSPAEIIAAARADGATTVQINHVHSFFGLSGGSGHAIDTGLTPPQSAVSGTAHRLDPSITNYFPSEPDRPDALEIWIGDDRGQVYGNFLGRNIGDWFNMLNQGILKTGLANSDTHRRVITQAGVPRNMVASSTDAPGSIVPADVSTNINAGRTFGTNGPIVRVRTHADSTGEDGGLGIGESKTISTTDGEVEIEVEIESPIWAEFDTVEYYVNSTTTKSTSIKESGVGPVVVPSYSVTPDYVRTAPADFTVSTVVDFPGIPGASHLEATATLTLSGLTDDIWVVVLVRGTDGVSKPLFPVVPNDIKAKACSNNPCKSCTTDANCTSPGTCTVSNETVGALTDGNLGQCGMTAMAFTNPLFVDVNGGGWTAPGVQVNP